MPIILSTSGGRNHSVTPLARGTRLGVGVQHSGVRQQTRRWNFSLFSVADDLSLETLSPRRASPVREKKQTLHMRKACFQSSRDTTDRCSTRERLGRRGFASVLRKNRLNEKNPSRGSRLGRLVRAVQGEVSAATRYGRRFIYKKGFGKSETLILGKSTRECSAS